MDDVLNARHKEVLAALQAPIADEFLSWKPGATYGKDNLWSGIYFPYVNKEFYEERLDAVVGAAGWDARYERDSQDFIHCYLTIHLPGERSVTRQGIALGYNSEAKEKDKQDLEKAGRTTAFRDACKAHGICGRDINNAQTGWVPIKVDRFHHETKKPQYFKPAVPLTRALLHHSGAANGGDGGGSNASARGVVVASPESKVRNPEAHSQLGDAQELKSLDISEADKITWPIGKHKGKPLASLPSSYLEWAMTNTGLLNQSDTKFDQFLYDAVVLCLASKQEGKTIAAKDEKASPEEVAAIFSGDEEIPF